MSKGPCTYHTMVIMLRSCGAFAVIFAAIFGYHSIIQHPDNNAISVPSVEEVSPVMTIDETLLINDKDDEDVGMVVFEPVIPLEMVVLTAGDIPDLHSGTWLVIGHLETSKQSQMYIRSILSLFEDVASTFTFRTLPLRFAILPVETLTEAGMQMGVERGSRSVLLVDGQVRWRDDGNISNISKIITKIASDHTILKPDNENGEKFWDENVSKMSLWEYRKLLRVFRFIVRDQPALIGSAGNLGKAAALLLPPLLSLLSSKL